MLGLQKDLDGIQRMADDDSAEAGRVAGDEAVSEGLERVRVAVGVHFDFISWG